ncbi:Myotubularin- protein 3 [Bulinus truncatus]|nr:Myotubularin- protein 3 [Bulinus truncatus]
MWFCVSEVVRHVSDSLTPTVVPDVMDTPDTNQVPEYQTSNPCAKVPNFPLLPGEYPVLISKTVDGDAMVTNFRFCMGERRSFINLPLMTVSELFVIEATRRLRIGCKDASTFSCTFATAEDCSQCLNALRERIGLPTSKKDIFAFTFCKAATQKDNLATGLLPEEVQQIRLCKPGNDVFTYSFDAEIKRLGFDTSQKKIWRISQANQKYEYCSTYPREHILPATYDDEKLKGSLEFRAMKRFPSVVWRDKTSGVVIIRSSQPLSSFLGLSFGYFQNQLDVSLLEEIVNACGKERELLALEELNRAGLPILEQEVSGHSRGGNSNTEDRELNDFFSTQSDLNTMMADDNPDDPRTRKLAIVDCRSLAGVWGNSFKGGGTEDEGAHNLLSHKCPLSVVYKCNIIHLDLANIHNVRDSFNKLRALCHSYVEGTFLKNLSGCLWLSYISALLRGANCVVELIHNKKRPVLVHCSDGWDRTSQIVSLSEIMLDPYYRTFDGFQVVVEREWLHFGHKFGERGGHDPNCSDTNQVSPIFLQFLDCVFQLTLQNPADFQFNEAYLIKLLKHSQACLFGNFLHNCQRERDACSLKFASVWSLLRPDNINLVNLLYRPSSRVLTARFSEHDVILWKSVYMAGLSPFPHSDFCLDSSSVTVVSGSGSGEDGVVPLEGLPRSKSMDDLSKATSDSGRRNSVPSIPQCPESVSVTPCASGLEDGIEVAVIVEKETSQETCVNGESGLKELQVMLPDPSDLLTVQGEEVPMLSLIPGQESPSHPSEHQNGESKQGDTPSNNLESGHGAGDDYLVGDCSSGHQVQTTNSITKGPFLSDSIQMSGVSPGHRVETTDCTDQFKSCDCTDQFKSCDCSDQFESCDSVCLNHTSVLSSKFLPNGLCQVPVVENGHKDVHIHSISKLTPCSHPSPRNTCSGECCWWHVVSSLSEHLTCYYENEAALSGHKAELLNNRLNLSQHTHCDAQQHSCTEGTHSKHPRNGECVSEIMNGKLVSDTCNYIHCKGKSGKPESGAARSELDTEDTKTNVNSESTDTLIGDPTVDHPHSPTLLHSKLAETNLKRTSTWPLKKDDTSEMAEAGIIRKARAASGASRDLSVSPRDRRNWSDTGRLRHTSGNDSVARGWISSTVSTSTTDLTDSFVKKVSTTISLFFFN